MGPTIKFCDELHATKYRGVNESFEEAMARVAAALADNEEHRKHFKNILQDMRFMPGGRVQSAIGSARDVTPYNCFVSMTVEDSMESIMEAAKRAAETMRQGGGIGYDFSRIRPRGDLIASQESIASGPISFMRIFDAVCGTVASAGHRRGAQMGVLRVDHPDIEEFIRAKQNDNQLTNFNVSIGVTDDFMNAVVRDLPFSLKFEGRVYKKVNARGLWDEIMRGTWDWAEPGVLFLDRINEDNNLHYCELIEATNPCAEQPLPPNGACLLGSFNLTRYLAKDLQTSLYYFDYEKFQHDIPAVVRAMDNVVDVAKYPLKEQEEEAKNKRRMGLGITGLANTIEVIGASYGSEVFIEITKRIMSCLTKTAYETSVALSVEKGAFPLFDREEYCASNFLDILDNELIEKIYRYGIRNSHLISIAPTGTISLCADNISSGIEPPYALSVERLVQTEAGPQSVLLEDYALRTYGVRGRTAGDLTVKEHLDVLLAVQPYVDSAVSKTLNVGDGVTYNEFKDIYLSAWRGGAKGCTTFRASGKRFGILQSSTGPVGETSSDSETEVSSGREDNEGSACYYDPATGKKECE